MKTFRQTIQEVSDNKPLSESRVRPMAQNFSTFEDEILDARLSSYFLNEAPLSGRTTNFGPPAHIAGSFYKYVETNKEQQKKPFEANKKTNVYDVDTHEIIPDVTIKKGAKFKIIDKFE